MPLVFRKWRFHLSGRSRLLSFCIVAHAIGLQKMAFPSFWVLEARVFLQSSTLVFRKWRFHLSGRSRLLSFCIVAHAIGLQKMVFPSFWALEAPVFLQSSTCHWSSKNGVSIFLGVARFAVKPLRCRPHPHHDQIQAAGGAASEVLRRRSVRTRSTASGMPLRLRRSRELRYGRCGK